MKGHSLRTTVISHLTIQAIVLHGLHTSSIQFIHLIWNPVILCNSISPFNYLTCSFSWVVAWYCTWTAHICLTVFSGFVLFFFLSFYFCSCLKVSNFYLNLFVSLQHFLNLNFFLSCSFIYHLVCFILKYASVSFFYRERKKKANLLLLCPVPVNSRSFSYLLCAVYCCLFASKIKAVLWLHHHGQITERQLISEQWYSEKQMRHEAAVVRDYGKTLFWFLDVLRNFGSHWTLPKEEQGFGTFANQPANGAPSCRPWDSAMPSPAWAETGPG